MNLTAQSCNGWLLMLMREGTLNTCPKDPSPIFLASTKLKSLWKSQQVGKLIFFYNSNLKELVIYLLLIMEEQEEVSQIVSEEGNMTDVQDDLVKNDDSKVDFLERVKGLFGFGSYLKVQQIGFVFFIPIPSSWAFKTQVVVTQFITIVYSIAIYLVFQHVSQSVVENIINDWQSNIFDEHLFTLMDHVRWNYDELITESLELSNIYLEIINT